MAQDSRIGGACLEKVNERNCSTTESKNEVEKGREKLKVGDVVVVIAPETTRGHWPLGRVEEIFPGKDGKVRVIRIHLAGKSYIRPIHRLCKLLSCTDD